MTRQTLLNPPKGAEGLAALKRSIANALKREERRMAFLERSSDECWAYSDAELKYDRYLVLMSNSQAKIDALAGCIKQLGILEDEIQQTERLLNTNETCDDDSQNESTSR